MGSIYPLMAVVLSYLGFWLEPHSFNCYIFRSADILRYLKKGVLRHKGLHPLPVPPPIRYLLAGFNWGIQKKILEI